MFNPVILVLGGASSGKSAFAERLVDFHSRPMTYVATAQPHDEEMAVKIAAHRAARGPGWTTVEAPLEPGDALRAIPSEGIALFDCATLWLTNHILAYGDLAAAESRLMAALDAMRAPVVIVSNEVGQGIVPETSLGRRFRSAQGGLNQRLAARADLVVLVVAGLPLVLKGTLPEGFA